MKCFYRNETLHQTGSVDAGHNRKALPRRELARGMAYATHTLEGSNSLFEGCDDVYFTYPSQIRSDYCGIGGSRLWRLQQPDKSVFLPAQSSFPIDGQSRVVLPLHPYLGCLGLRRLCE
jgi:hypothetical protein